MPPCCLVLGNIDSFKLWQHSIISILTSVPKRQVMTRYISYVRLHFFGKQILSPYEISNWDLLNVLAKPRCCNNASHNNHCAVSHQWSVTFEDTLVCVGLWRSVTVAFLRRVQIFLLTYLPLTTRSHNITYNTWCCYIWWRWRQCWCWQWQWWWWWWWCCDNEASHDLTEEKAKCDKLPWKT